MSFCIDERYITRASRQKENQILSDTNLSVQSMSNTVK